MTFCHVALIFYSHYHFPLAGPAVTSVVHLGYTFRYILYTLPSLQSSIFIRLNARLGSPNAMSAWSDMSRLALREYEDEPRTVPELTDGLGSGAQRNPNLTPQMGPWERITPILQYAVIDLVASVVPNTRCLGKRPGRLVVYQL